SLYTVLKALTFVNALQRTPIENAYSTGVCAQSLLLKRRSTRLRILFIPGHLNAWCVSGAAFVISGGFEMSKRQVWLIAAFAVAMPCFSACDDGGTQSGDTVECGEGTQLNEEGTACVPTHTDTTTC